MGSDGFESKRTGGSAGAGLDRFAPGDKAGTAERTPAADPFAISTVASAGSAAATATRPSPVSASSSPRRAHARAARSGNPNQRSVSTSPGIQ